MDADQFAALLADLDSQDFKTRQKATQELEKLGERAEARLRAALVAQPALEVQQRIEALLARLEVSPLRLRTLRAVEVLEHVGSPDAREALESLARGPGSERLTREASVALERLSKAKR